MFEKIDSLPRSQSESALNDGNRELRAGERGADMGRHVVGAFVLVPIAPRLLGRQAFEKRLEISANVRGGVLLNEQSSGGMPAKQGQEPGLQPVGLSQSRTSCVISTNPRPRDEIRRISTN
jgi:hypothetical protein